MKYWSLKDKKALVIDDMLEARSMLKSVLKSVECENVKSAKDAKEAIGFMQSNYFDFILCDYNLGDNKDGQQILEEAKFLDILPYHTVFMMVTAENTSKMVMGALDWSPDDYVQKPITKTILTGRLKRLLERKQGLKEISKAMLGENKDFAKALDLCNKKINEEPSPVYDLIKLKAELLLKLNKNEEAIELCQTFFNAREVSAIGLLLGKALFQAERLKEAEEIINKVLSHNDKYIVAYDLLAKIKASQDELEESQKILESAVKHSPKAVVRQRNLAETAFKNESFAIAENAYKQAINHSKHSCFRKYQDYIGRAQSLSKNKQEGDALSVVNDLKKEYKRDPVASLHATLLESHIYKDIQKNDLSLAALDSAYGIFQKTPEQMPTDLIIEMAKDCLVANKRDQADNLMNQAIKNNPDDPNIKDQIKEARASVAWLKSG